MARPMSLEAHSAVLTLIRCGKPKWATVPLTFFEITKLNARAIFLRNPITASVQSEKALHLTLRAHPRTSLAKQNFMASNEGRTVLSHTEVPFMVIATFGHVRKV